MYLLRGTPEYLIVSLPSGRYIHSTCYRRLEDCCHKPRVLNAVLFVTDDNWLVEIVPCLEDCTVYCSLPAVLPFVASDVAIFVVFAGAVHYVAMLSF